MPRLVVGSGDARPPLAELKTPVSRYKHMLARSILPACLWVVVVLGCSAPTLRAENVTAASLRTAIEKALPLLERASAGSAEQRKCFTCHSQALPVFALTEARRRGFEVDADNLQRQLEHTQGHLKRGRKSYSEGKGQGGGVDTAGYALWTLEYGDRESGEVTQIVTDWLLDKQKKDGHWDCSSHRPPSEASDFTTTYLAIRALHSFAIGRRRDDVEAASELAGKWLMEAKPMDNEDRVFRLLSLDYIGATSSLVEEAVEEIKRLQRDDGGWSQLSELESDAYATGTTLYALAQSGLSSDDAVWMSGIGFLLASQLDDGSWHVASRSKPFQKYFETGFPHKQDQFLSTTASSWATLALLSSLGESESESESVGLLLPNNSKDRELALCR